MDEKRFALIIANSEYQDPDLQKLLAPSSDAEALANVLRDPKIGEFKVKALINKRSSEVNEEIDMFFADRGRDDVLLFYFSGHGIKDEDGSLFFATENTRRKFPGSTSIPSAFVNATMDRCRARRKILLLDCCYSGAFFRGMRAKADKNINTGEYFQQGRGSVVITASDAMQYSFEGDDLEGSGKRSIFTSAIVEGLKPITIRFFAYYSYCIFIHLIEQERNYTINALSGLYSLSILFCFRYWMWASYSSSSLICSIRRLINRLSLAYTKIFLTLYA